MLKLDQLKVSINSKEDLVQIVSKKLKISTTDIEKVEILKKSVDARKKTDIFYVYSLKIVLNCNEKRVLTRNSSNKNLHKYQEKNYVVEYENIHSLKRPIIIGAGPAGLFCAYLLALNGLEPIVFERGKSVYERQQDILDFWETGVLKPDSNVQFGEGGAGTFSDGKLNTLVNDKFLRNKFVLETFVKFGAPSKILYEAKPHIGTDILIDVIKNIREEIIRLGATFHFNTLVDDFIIENKIISGIHTSIGEFYSDCIVLAIGHSSRDTFYKLYERGVHLEAKDFAVGFRIEHPQMMISESMYGKSFDVLEPASYKLTTNLDNGRGVYSFCMCPGGFVVNSSSENNRLVVNGMSYSKRDSKNANSAIVITVDSREFDKNEPLSAIEYQRKIESRAYNLAQGFIPQQLFCDFKNKIQSKDYGDFASEVKGRTAFADLNDILSNELNTSIAIAIDEFGKKIKGYNRPDAILSGIESRTSSPVRILRDERFVANIEGLFPCGEGAGYAGGITSAAMDGLKVAEAIIESKISKDKGGL